MAAIDYDPYDALLHHVYQQVRCGLSLFFFFFPVLASLTCSRSDTGRGVV